MPSQAAFRLLFHTAGASGIPEEPADRIMRQIGTLLDGKNLAGGKELLKKLGQDRQIIYFTCAKE